MKLSRWNFQDEIFKTKFSRWNFQDEIFKMKFSRWNFQDEIFKMKFSRWNFQHDIFNMKFSTWNFQDEISKTKFFSIQFSNINIFRSKLQGQYITKKRKCSPQRLWHSPLFCKSKNILEIKKIYWLRYVGILFRSLGRYSFSYVFFWWISFYLMFFSV